MGRPRKTEGGKARSLFVRDDQLRHLDELALEAGLDASDVVRAFLDFLLPGPAGESGRTPTPRPANPAYRVKKGEPAPAYLADPSRRARARAALERDWRRVRHSKPLAWAVLTGWKANELVIPGGVPAPAQSIRVARQCVAAIRWLQMTPDKPDREDLGPDVRLANDWAANSPDRLLHVIASPGVRVVHCTSTDDAYAADRPDEIVVSPRLAAAAGGELPVEKMYQDAGRGLAELIQGGELKPLERWSRYNRHENGADLLPWDAYQVVWSHRGLPSSDG
jgi:hypothetical protein